MALDRWPEYRVTHRFELLEDKSHQWTYRGQITPSNKKVVVEAIVKDIEDGPEPLILADGLLKVDGLYIYKMENYGLKLSSADYTKQRNAPACSPKTGERANGPTGEPDI
jgi:hypothetical protein